MTEVVEEIGVVFWRLRGRIADANEGGFRTPLRTSSPVASLLMLLWPQVISWSKGLKPGWAAE